MTGVLITAVNLRISIIAVSPVLDDIRDDVGLSSTIAGLLTTLPVLCFGLFSPIAPRLAHRFGLDPALFGAMIVLAAAIAIRSLPSTTVLFLATALIGMAIGVGNVLLPASIKRDFPHQTGLMTGLLTMALSASGTIGAGLTIPLQDASGLNWRCGRSLW
jgi:CP family cyanate transporter-like MFS transporter